MERIIVVDLSAFMGVITMIQSEHLGKFVNVASCDNHGTKSVESWDLISREFARKVLQR